MMRVDFGRYAPQDSKIYQKKHSMLDIFLEMFWNFRKITPPNVSGQLALSFLTLHVFEK